MEIELVSHKLYMYIAANVALNKPVYQSSTQGGYEANRAIDMDKRSDLSLGGCTQTNTGFNQWWAVDLEKTFTIYMVKIVNRGDCCGVYNFFIS